MGGRRRRGGTPEAREAQLVNDAYNVAEERIRSGKASDSLIVQVLRLGSIRAEKENRKIDYENDLLQAKRDAIVAEREAKASYDKVLRVLKGYDADFSDDEDEDYEED